MPSAGRVAVVLVVLAGILFAAPPTVVGLVDDGEDLSTKELGARPLGESHDGEQIDETKDLVRTWESEHVLDLRRYASLAASGRTDRLDCNRAVNVTLDVMREATTEGSVATTSADVAEDLHCMADRYDYYRPPGDEHGGYYAFTVTSDVGVTTVQTRQVNDSTVAAAIRERERVGYDELNPTERRTVDRVLENSTASYGSYRPPADDPVLDRVPMLLRADGETYVVEVVGHVDDVDLAAVALRLGLRGTAVLSLLGALVAGGVVVYERRRADELEGLGARR